MAVWNYLGFSALNQGKNNRLGSSEVRSSDSRSRKRYFSYAAPVLHFITKASRIMIFLRLHFFSCRITVLATQKLRCLLRIQSYK